MSIPSTVDIDAFEVARIEFDLIGFNNTVVGFDITGVSATSSVPEPSSLALIGIVVPAVLARRHRLG